MEHHPGSSILEASSLASKINTMDLIIQRIAECPSKNPLSEVSVLCVIIVFIRVLRRNAV